MTFISFLQVLDAVDVANNSNEHKNECVSIVLEFLHTLMELSLPQLKLHHQRLIETSLKLIQNNGVDSQAMSLMRIVALNTDSESRYILEPILNSLPAFLTDLESKDEEIPTNVEYNKRISILMELLKVLVQTESFRDRVLSIVKLEHIEKIFSPLICNRSPRTRACDADTSSAEAVELYINALVLVHELARCNHFWSEAQQNLLQQKYVTWIFNSKCRIPTVSAFFFAVFY